MIEIKVTGRKIERFLRKLNQNNINIYKINKNILLIDEKDLEKVEKLKTIYEIEIISRKGIKNTLKKINKIFIMSIILSIGLLILLSNIIFTVNIITEDKEIRELVEKELIKYGIEEHKLKKSEKYLVKITKKILKENKDNLEWLYIEETGTTYNIKIQQRKLKREETENKARHVVAKKNAVIKRIIASTGEIMKIEGQYVRKGDIIVSGEIKLYEEVKSITSATAEVYGEVWYKTTIEQPIIYYATNKNEDLNINFYFLNYTINIKGQKENNKLKSLLPIGLQITKGCEKETSTILTLEEAKLEALKNSREKINSQLNDKEYILTEKLLKEEVNNSKIVLEIFYSVYEDITDYLLIE